jgi:putative methionine-R-sulfoxide reductase with GAF domain
MNRQSLLILLLSLLPVSRIAGQELAENNFDLYTTAEGMSHNSISGITQDSTGYVWIATSYGLNRFDGSNFLQFHSNSDSLSLAAEELAGMAWLDDHRLAVFTSGLYIMDTRTGNTHNLFIPYHNRQYQFKYNMIERVMGGDNGDMYILTRSGFYHYDKNYKLLSRFDFYSEGKVAVTHFYFGRGLFELDSKRLLIISIGGLYIYDKVKMQFTKMTAADCPLMAEFLNYPGTDYQFYQPKPGTFFVLKSASDTLVYINTSENKKIISRLPFDRISTEFGWRSRLVAASDTDFYITGHHSGFYKLRFDSGSGVVKLYPEKYFPFYLCSGIVKDKDKNLWVATNRGLFRQDPQRSKVQVGHLPAGIENSFPNIIVDDIYVSGDKIYAGARGNAGLFLFDKQTFRLEKQIIFKHIKDDNRVNHIRSIVSADRSTLLLGTIGPLLLFDIASKKEKQVIPQGWNPPGDWTSDMFKDRKGNIWISSHYIYKYNPLTKNFTAIPNLDRLLSVPFVISEDTAGHIWMAGHGLARYNTLVDSFDLVLDSFPFIKMPDKQINAMVVDQQNTVWFNSNNNGLTGYNIASRSFRHFTRSDGLPDDNIASLIVIGNKLWMACFSGIACMDLQTLQIVSFGKEDGFPDMPVVRGARFFYDSGLHQLYLGFSHAIVRFNPYDILRRKSPPHVFIESLAINGQKNILLPGRRVTTTWQSNEVMITIGSINFSDGNSQSFAYRIAKDEQTPWQQLGSQPSFSISNLSPGSYRIQVKCFSLNNRWPEQVKEINIVVLPPFWMKEWFIISISVIVLVLLYLFIRWRTGLARKNEMEKTHIQKLKADDYKSQFELEQISNYFSSSLDGKKTEEEVLWDVASNLIGRMNYVDCMIYLWNEDKTKMVQKAAYGPKGKPEFISANVFDVLPGQGIVGHVIKTRQPVLLEDTRKDSRYRVDEEFRLSEVCVPIIHNDELMGIIDSEHYQPGYFGERDIKILTTIATLIANKLKQIGSEQSLEVKQKELATINEQLAEARLSALQAQMNPHFVFNALNSIKRMILDSDNDKASRYLSKFALMIRMTLNHSKEIFVTLSENIEYLKAYLEMEQLRFDDSFTYSISTGENIDTEETAIPSLMMQPLVENAIWHGLMQAERDKKIRIGFTLCQNKITCTIEDNGIGIRQSEKLRETNRPLHQSMGLENLQKRIKIMNEKYDMDCSLEITDLEETRLKEQGTRVVLQFNLINV